VEFYVIYSVDTHGDGNAGWGLPRKEILGKLNQTEDDEEYDYSYLGGRWETGFHRKYCGVLKREDFETFLNDTCLSAEDSETMGSLTEMGWMPAISFSADDDDSIISCYVTPHVDGIAGTEEQWNRLRDAIVSKYKEW
jgi:hypothetical protein